MFWLVVTFIAVAVCLGAVFVRRVTQSAEARTSASIVAVLAIAGWFAISLLLTGAIIGAGHIGLVKTFGDYTGELSPGVAFKWPWQTVEEVTVRTQSKHIVMNEKAAAGTGSAVSRETQPVYATVTLNYSLEAGKVTDLYRTVGSNYYEAIVEPRVLQVFKSETVRYSTVEVAPNRERIRRDVQAILDRQLKPYGIHVSDFLINDLDFAEAFVDAITAKQVQTQRALTAKEKVRQARFEAQQKIETARGAATSRLIAARAEARANRLLARSLTERILRLRSIEKLNPRVSTVFVPPGTNLLLSPQTAIPSP